LIERERECVIAPLRSRTEQDGSGVIVGGRRSQMYGTAISRDRSLMGSFVYMFVTLIAPFMQQSLGHLFCRLPGNELGQNLLGALGHACDGASGQFRPPGANSCISTPSHLLQHKTRPGGACAPAKSSSESRGKHRPVGWYLQQLDLLRTRLGHVRQAAGGQPAGSSAQGANKTIGPGPALNQNLPQPRRPGH
jgi:hypothetical protein